MENKEKILCVLPLYEKDLGNVTQIITANGGEVLLPQSIESVLKSICSYYSLHLRLIRKKQQQLLNCRYYTPLPLSSSLLLFPIKTRTPKIKNDSSIGYINYFALKKMDYPQAALHLENNRIVYSLNNGDTLKKRYNQAVICSKLYKETHGGEEYLQEEKTPYFYPVTQRDIEPILRELAAIRGILTGILSSL